MMENPTLMKEQKPWYKDKAYQGIAALVIVILWIIFGSAEPETLTIEKIVGAIAAVYALFGRMFDRKKEKQ